MVLCDDLDGGVGEGVDRRSKKEGIYIPIAYLIHFVVQQKLTQYCKATILQLKEFVKKNIQIMLERVWRKGNPSILLVRM